MIKPCPITMLKEMLEKALKMNLTNLKPVLALPRVISLFEVEDSLPTKASSINSKKGTVSEACLYMVRLPLLTLMLLIVTWRMNFQSSSVTAATSLSKCLT